MKELSKSEQDHWHKRAEEWLSGIAINKNAPGSEHKDIFVALRDAIFTIRERDREIKSLKG